MLRRLYNRVFHEITTLSTELLSCIALSEDFAAYQVFFNNSRCISGISTGREFHMT